MQSGGDQLVVRQHERVLCKAAAQARVAEASAPQVILARNSIDAGSCITLTAVDCSRGGMGLESPIFIPRATQLHVRLRSGAADTPDVEFLARVQRVTMVNRTPTYYVGVAFLESGEDFGKRVEAALAIARANKVQPASTPTPGTTAPTGSAPTSTKGIAA